jgi:hypothetical protein
MDHQRSELAALMQEAERRRGKVLVVSFIDDNKKEISRLVLHVPVSPDQKCPPSQWFEVGENGELRPRRRLRLRLY